jgi:cell division protein FtsL
MRLVKVEVQLAERSVQWDTRMQSLEETLDMRLTRVEKILMTTAGAICLSLLGVVAAAFKFLPKG